MSANIAILPFRRGRVGASGLAMAAKALENSFRCLRRNGGFEVWLAERVKRLSYCYGGCGEKWTLNVLKSQVGANAAACQDVFKNHRCLFSWRGGPFSSLLTRFLLLQASVYCL